MCDAFLVLAKTEPGDGGLSCFFVPRWCPDGSANPILIQRLKDKLGNQANAAAKSSSMAARSAGWSATKAAACRRSWRWVR